MRVTNEMTYRMLISNMRQNLESLYEIQHQIASGRKINRPSDDPTTYEIVRRLYNDVSATEQFARNAERAQDDLVVADSALQNLLGILHRAEELAVRSTDVTLTSNDLISMGKESDQLLDALLDVANTSDQGAYIFAGLRTDTKPYDAADTDFDGFVDTITYRGDTGIHRTEIGKQVYLETNMPGSNPAGQNAVFQTATVDLFDNLIQLRDRFLSGQTAAGTAILDDLNTGLEHIVGMLSTVGGRQERLQINTEILAQREVDLTSALDREVSVDIASAATRLSSVQLAYEAALQSASLVLNQTNLMHMI